MSEKVYLLKPTIRWGFSFVISCASLYFIAWGMIPNFSPLDIFTSYISVLYVAWFNSSVYLAFKIDKQLDKVLPWKKNQKLRFWIELVIIFIMAILFFYIVSILSGLFQGELKWFPNKASITISILSSIILLLQTSSLLVQNFLQNWQAADLRAEQLKQQKLQFEYKALQAQLNPHFLFNSLNVLVSEIEHDPQKAKNFALDLADVYRYVLQSKDKQTVTLKEEWEAVKSYIELHQVRLGDGLVIKTKFSEETLEREIPPLTLQTLVENCLKHNQATVRKPLKIEIIAEGTALRINNNLQPKLNPTTHGVGLGAVKQRYALLKAESEVNIQQDKTHFQVTVPLI
ncbi:sensor histidine kinase [Sediminitomix flava]|uniref:Histidine kinase n=1 Tax=Sediminitomix flava TaxID=379075 RepID=A0A315ZGI2_SEDFL|nr:histidine kinase [Sediminitomix flava]PWJ44230.1 histidine kinase [Sediminitomix flava]